MNDGRLAVPGVLTMLGLESPACKVQIVKICLSVPTPFWLAGSLYAYWEEYVQSCSTFGVWMQHQDRQACLFVWMGTESLTAELDTLVEFGLHRKMLLGVSRSGASWEDLSWCCIHFQSLSTVGGLLLNVGYVCF